jgi:hypothetical protein
VVIFGSGSGIFFAWDIEGHQPHRQLGVLDGFYVGATYPIVMIVLADGLVVYSLINVHFRLGSVWLWKIGERPIELGRHNKAVKD